MAIEQWWGSLACHTYCDTWHLRPRYTNTYCLAFSSGVTTWYNDLDLSQLRFEHPTFCMQGKSSYRMRDRRGYNFLKYNGASIDKKIFVYSLRSILKKNIRTLKNSVIEPGQHDLSPLHRFQEIILTKAIGLHLISFYIIIVRTCRYISAFFIERSVYQII